MPPQTVSLNFEDLLTPSGLLSLKTRAEQVIADPMATAELLFTHFRQQLETQELAPAWKIPVSIDKDDLGKIRVKWTPPAVGMPGAAFNLSGLASELGELEFRLNEAGTALEALQMGLKSKLEAFRDKVTQLASVIPFRLRIDEVTGQFCVEQQTSGTPLQVNVGGLSATLLDSSLKFTADSITALDIEAEVRFPGMLNADGSGEEPALLHFIHSGNRFTVNATNLPPAHLQGLTMQVNSINLLVENGNILPTSTTSGKITLDFLDEDQSGPGQIDFSISFGDEGMITYQANNPAGRSFRKGPVQLKFSMIQVITQPGQEPAVTIRGVFWLDGLNQDDSETEFEFSYVDSEYNFLGSNFPAIPAGFGSMTFTHVLLKISSSGTITASEWSGNLQIPLFSEGSLAFEVSFDNETDTFSINAANQDNIPLRHGDLSLVLQPFSIIFTGGNLANITGNGQLTFPLITGPQPMGVELFYDKQSDTLKVSVTNFSSPQLAGCQLNFEKAEFMFMNGLYISSDIKGRLTLPGVTNGTGIGFLLQIGQQGKEILFSINNETGPHQLRFGPVSFNLFSLAVRILNNELERFEGSGTMELPSAGTPFNFSFTCDSSVDPPRYLFTISELTTSLGFFELQVLRFNLTTQAGHEFELDSEGKLWLPVFSRDNGGLSFKLDIPNTSTYRIETQSGDAFISFFGFSLSRVHVMINVIDGVIEDYIGSGSLLIPGFPSSLEMQITYIKNTKNHTILLLNPVTGISFFGGIIDLETFMLELIQNAFSRGSASGKLKLPGATGENGLSANLTIDNQGNYTVVISGNNEKLNFKVVELEIPSPGFIIRVVNGNLQQVSGTGNIIFPGLDQPDPITAGFTVTGSGTPVVYDWNIITQNVGASIAGIQLFFEKIELAGDSNGNFSADINGRLHLPVFTGGNGLNFNVLIPEDSNTAYKVTILQDNSVVKFGSFELSGVALEMEVNQGTLQDFTTGASLLIPGLPSALAVEVSYIEEANDFEKLTIELENAPAIGLFGGSIQLDLFRLILLNRQFDSCTGKGTLKLPGASGDGGIKFLFDMTGADQGNSYRLSLDSAHAREAVLDFQALQLHFGNFTFEAESGKLKHLDAGGSITIGGLTETALNFSFHADAPAIPDAPFNYSIHGTGSAKIGGFSLDSLAISLENQDGNFSASASGTLKLPVFNQGSLGFGIAFSNSGKDYDIVINELPLLQFGGFGLILSGLTIKVKEQALDELVIPPGTRLKIPGIEAEIDVGINYDRLNSADQESLEVALGGSISVDFGGGSITIDTFSLLILNGGFNEGKAAGKFKLPGSTDGAGISFVMDVNNNGNGFSLNMTGNSQENVLSFGPVALGFESFSLVYDTDHVDSVSGGGSLKLPGFDQPVTFAISSDPTGFKLLVEDADLNLGDFQVYFEEIKLISAHPDFSLEASGYVKLPVFDNGELNFDMAVNNTSNYGFAITQPANTPLSFGPLVLSDFALNMQVEESSINSATGSGKLKVSDFIPDPFGILVSYSANGVRLFKFGIDPDNSVTFNLKILELTLKGVDFEIANGVFTKGELSGEVTIPACSGAVVGFKFIYGPSTHHYLVSILGTGNITCGPLTLNEIGFSYEKQGDDPAEFSGTVALTLPGATDPATLAVTSEDSTLTFSADLNDNPFMIGVGGFEIGFKFLLFAIKDNKLDSLNFSGLMTIPACEEGFNTLEFIFSLTEGGNRFKLDLNEDITTVLKLGKVVTLHLNGFSLEIEDDQVESLSGSAGLSIDGLPETTENPITVSFRYDDPEYFIGLTAEDVSLGIGGFELTLEDLNIAFTPGELQSFEFGGQLKIPGLKKANGDPASVGVEVVYNKIEEKLILTGSSDAVFTIGSLSVSNLHITGEQAGSSFGVMVSGTLTISIPGGESSNVDIEIEIKNDGTFVLKGNATPPVQLLDIAEVVSISLSKIELSRDNLNKWDFALGGLIENKIVIAGMDNLLPSELKLRELKFGQAFNLDLGVKWPSGLVIDIGGAGGGEVSIPVNGNFGGAVSLDALKISYTAFDVNPVTIKFSFMGAAIKLGPVAAAVDGLGLKAIIDKRDPDVNPGNFGIVQIDVAFLPPAGLGVSLDTPVFSGGGYLYFDNDKGEYAGAIELAFMEMFAISAIGVINTKMPDGQPGTSVLFIMCVEFSPGIALGYGFFLSGLGGMIGIHRTIMVDRLRDGVKTGAISNILFPRNIIANINSIISNIKDIFPVKRDQFVIGPMAAITFGVPTILRIDLGLAIEFASPVRFGILGVLRVILPDEKAALLKIQVAFLGLVDFEKKMLSFDASLFDSKILTFGLEGDMVMRLSWGEQKDFLLSVGGFHPRYTPPSYLSIPRMKKLTLNILSGNPRLTLSAYFALTTNTVQFGAGIDFYFSVSKFKIVGEFGFDVLFQFSPFYFVADAHARLAVKLGDTTLLGISLEFKLEGPAPWKARGTAEFTILFFTVEVQFEKIWGESHITTLPDIEVLPLLLEAVRDNRNWRSITGSRSANGVRMKPAGSSELLVLTPNGNIEVLQKIVPLKVNIEKFGQFNPSGYTRFEIIEPRIGNIQTGDPEYVDDVFAPANFLKISDDEKLKLPSFEKQNAGIRIRGSRDNLKAGAFVNRTVNYEQIIDDGITITPIDIKASFGVRESTFLMTHGAIRRSTFSNRKQLLVNPSKVKMNEPGFTVVNTDNLAPVKAAGRNGFMQAHEEVALTGPSVQLIPFDIVNS